VKPRPSTDQSQINLELDARACSHAIWIGLLLARRAGWMDVVNTLTLVHATASERRRALEDLGQ